MSKLRRLYSQGPRDPTRFVRSFVYQLRLRAGALPLSVRPLAALPERSQVRDFPREVDREVVVLVRYYDRTPGGHMGACCGADFRRVLL